MGEYSAKKLADPFVGKELKQFLAHLGQENGLEPL